jgi:hypothetical protein
MMLVEGVEAFGEGEQDEELMHGGKSRGGGGYCRCLCAKTEEEMGEGVGASSVRG